MDIDSLARAQDGVVSRTQALQSLTKGRVRWLLKRGDWKRVHPGVYQTHTGPLDWPGRAMAALLFYGEGATLSRESAAFMWGLQSHPPPLVHVDVPHPTQAARRPGVRLRRRRRLLAVSRTSRLVTSAPFTVLDLADEATASRDDAISLATRAVHARTVTVDELSEELGRRRTHQHRTALTLGLGLVAQGAESGLEVAYLRAVIAAHALPPMRMAVPDRVAGVRVRRDFVNDEFGVVAEVDGRLGHEAEARTRDARRDRKTFASGRVTVRQTWVEVHYSPCELAADLFGVYRSRGYQGGVSLCSPTCDVQLHLARLAS